LTPYNVIREESRKITRDAFLSYLGNRYSVPYRFAGRTARLQIHDSTFCVFVGTEKVCSHEIMPGHGKVSHNKDHFKGLLSEILQQSTVSRMKGMNVIYFSDPEVEHRPLSVYDAFCKEA
jgi:hypothetical protein